jgi:hypothetical protein
LLLHSLRTLAQAHNFRQYEPLAIHASPISSVTVAPAVRRTNAGAKTPAQEGQPRAKMSVGYHTRIKSLWL